MAINKAKTSPWMKAVHHRSDHRVCGIARLRGPRHPHQGLHDSGDHNRRHDDYRLPRSSRSTPTSSRGVDALVAAAASEPDELHGSGESRQRVLRLGTDAVDAGPGCQPDIDGGRGCGGPAVARLEGRVRQGGQDQGRRPRRRDRLRDRDVLQRRHDLGDRHRRAHDQGDSRTSLRRGSISASSTQGPARRPRRSLRSNATSSSIPRGRTSRSLRTRSRRSRPLRPTP